MDPSEMRVSYERDSLDEAHVATVPLRQFETWFDEAVAAGVGEPNAMTVATVGADGRPSTRIVLMKGFDEAGVVFYTNYRSRKGRELAANPVAALQFHWAELERVVRIEGSVQRTTAAESDAYFASRPVGSRIGAWASPQSEVIGNREVLLANAQAASERYGDDPPRPEHWGGFRVVPDTWEFWQGRTSRLHDRLRYRLLPDGSWVRERLAP
ncbi:MAG: pyridoxamine 5'-phosphate oxidase [Micropruina sp.]|uniref:pyridoxamine 5'-phosphate oxidase n=1 Tax=Micropruina sp. TaxID=2737536 RepID=UPI0039E469C2